VTGQTEQQPKQMSDQGTTSTTPDQTAASESAATGEKEGKGLPQTASPLPLLALAGFGALALGVLMLKR
jgi:hypothetical protein